MDSRSDPRVAAVEPRVEAAAASAAVRVAVRRRGRWSRTRIMRALIIGVSVNETSRLTITDTAAVTPNW